MHFHPMEDGSLVARWHFGAQYIHEIGSAPGCATAYAQNATEAFNKIYPDGRPANIAVRHIGDVLENVPHAAASWLRNRAGANVYATKEGEVDFGAVAGRFDHPSAQYHLLAI